MLGINELRLRGKVAAAAETRTFGSGASLTRLLVSVQLDEPRRVDVLPCTVWDPVEEVRNLSRGDKVEIRGQVHRRFWSDSEGRHSRIEVVATTIDILATAGREAAQVA